MWRWSILLALLVLAVSCSRRVPPPEAPVSVVPNLPIINPAYPVTDESLSELEDKFRRSARDSSVSEQMGHKSVDVTTRIYGHPRPGSRPDLADLMDQPTPISEQIRNTLEVPHQPSIEIKELWRKRVGVEPT